MAHVILVDDLDNEVGTMEKIEAHEKGLLHRAFSILLFNSKHELLLQKRSKKKYHSGGLWSNTCCSHPLPKEELAQAAHRKLKHEMGIDLQPAFVYNSGIKQRWTKTSLNMNGITFLLDCSMENQSSTQRKLRTGNLWIS